MIKADSTKGYTFSNLLNEVKLPFSKMAHLTSVTSMQLVPLNGTQYVLNIWASLRENLFSRFAAWVNTTGLLSYRGLVEAWNFWYRN